MPVTETSFKATILIEPVAKGRPRLTVVNGHGRAYTPAKTRTAEQEIQWLIREQVIGAAGLRSEFPQLIPLRLKATFYRRRPLHLPKRITMPITRPDLTNYLKLLEDAINHYVIADDSQITAIYAKKRFAETGTPPRIEIEITEDLEVQRINSLSTPSDGAKEPK